MIMHDPANLAGRDERLRAVLHELERRFGPWIVYRLKDARPSAGCSAAISSGALSLDLALGIGGYPRGRITEIDGPASSGKSVLSFHLLASAQRQRGFIAFIDTGHRANFEQMARCGVDLADLFLVVPESAREAIEVAALLIESHGLDALVIGPLADLIDTSPQATREAADHLARLNAVLHRAPTVVLFQGEPGFRPSLASYNRALRHFATLRLEARPLRLLTHASGDVLGLRVQLTTLKNKLAPAQRQTTLDLRRDRGIHVEADLIDLGLRNGIIVETLAGLCLGSNFLGRGRARAIIALEHDPSLAQTLRQQIIEITRQ